MVRASWAISAALVFVCASHLPAQGRLQSVREEANGVPATSTDSASPSSTDDSDSFLGNVLGGILSAQDDDGHSIGGALLVGTVLAPFVVPAALLGDDYRERLYFTPHPYARGYRGYQILPTDVAEQFYDNVATDVRRKDWAARLLLENGNDFRGLNRVGGQLKLEHTSRWGVVSNWNWFHERLPCGCTDETLIGDTNITFRFAQNEIASMYTGLGVRVLTDRHQTDLGFNFTYGGDWFPVRPFVVSGVLDAGTLGSAGVFHTRGSVGAIWRGIEVFGGYDFLRIGSVNLHGPMVGVRWWF